MGVYDTIKVGDKEGQVKCWDAEVRLPRLFREGDPAPYIEEGLLTYSIAMREGGYVNVHAGYIDSWTEEPEYKPVFDKYGDRFSNSSCGIMAEQYFY